MKTPSLKQKFIFVAVSAVLGLGCIATALVNGAVYHSLRDRTQEQDAAAARYFAGLVAEPLIGLDTIRLAEISSDFARIRAGDLEYVFVLDADEGILYHTFEKGVPLAVLGANGPDTGGTLSMVSISLDGREIDDYCTPVRLGGERIGSVRAGFNLHRLQREFSRVIYLSLTLLGLSILMILFLAARLADALVRPILRLRDAAGELAAGRFDGAIDLKTGDEIQDLAEAFNAMSRDLKRSYSILEEKVATRTADLEQEIRENRAAREKLQSTMKDLEQSNKELEQFAYVASHDLKEPLRGIETFSKFLAEDCSDRLDADGKDYLKRIIAGAVRMRNLIDDLLSLSRVMRIRNPYETVDSGRLVAEASKRLQVLLDEKKVQLEVDDELPHIHCDPVKMREVFYNLIANAMKYNDKAEPTIEVGYRDGSFFVKDNGIGIPPEHHETVFQVFKRLHGREEFGGGTGAGLAIVHSIIQEHRGRIWIESGAGKGTTFRFTVPSKEAS